MNPRSYSNKTPASLSPDLLHFGDSSTIDPPINWCDDVHWLAIEMHQSSLIGLITRVNYNLTHSIKNFVQYTIFLKVFVCVCVSGEFRDGLNERPVRLRSHCSWMGKTKNHIESNSDFFGAANAMRLITLESLKNVLILQIFQPHLMRKHNYFTRRQFCMNSYDVDRSKTYVFLLLKKAQSSTPKLKVLAL